MGLDGERDLVFETSMATELVLLQDLCSHLDCTEEEEEAIAMDGLVSEMMKSLEKVIKDTSTIPSPPSPALSSSSVLEAWPSFSASDPMSFNALTEHQVTHGVTNGLDVQLGFDIEFLLEASDDELGIQPLPNPALCSIIINNNNNNNDDDDHNAFVEEEDMFWIDRNLEGSHVMDPYILLQETSEDDLMGIDWGLGRDQDESEYEESSNENTL